MNGAGKESRAEGAGLSEPARTVEQPHVRTTAMHHVRTAAGLILAVAGACSGEGATGSQPPPVPVITAAPVRTSAEGVSSTDQWQRTVGTWTGRCRARCLLRLSTAP